ncbi:MAG: hypothetical protein ACJ8AT_22485 [Hyalangium sp.]|uniref:hypothetical protein n=1 Tax=Hyalangium sp. TaxID=2028555 RepID=UPI00389AE6E9
MPLPRLLLVLAVASAVLLAPSARAVDLPRQMTFQGRLVRADGSPETAAQDLRFDLYATATGGAPLWEESHLGTPVTNGYYAVVLGASAPLPAGVLNGQALYLGVSIVGQSELTPRLPVVSVPYALRADDSNRLEGRAASTFADVNHTHSLVPLADDSNKLQGRAASTFADASHTHPVATPTVDGFMAAADKTKLNNAPNTYGNGLTLNAAKDLSVNFAGTGSANTAARSNHTHTLTCTYKTATGNTSASVSTAWCATNEILTGGGCTDLEASAVGAGTTFGPTGVTAVDGSTPAGSVPGYVCRTHTAVAPTAYAICCRIP